MELICKSDRFGQHGMNFEASVKGKNEDELTRLA